MTFSRSIFATLLVMFTACTAFAQHYEGLQLSTRDIQTLAALKVTPEYVRDMREFFPEITAREITSLYALKVTPNYLKEMRAYFPDISVRDVTSLYALKVPPNYLKDMRVHFPEMSVRDVTSLYALKVPPSYVKQIRDLGYDDISIREITSLYALKVKPEYIQQMREAGEPVVPGQHGSQFKVHVPEIHVPEIHIPEIHVSAIPGSPSESSVSHKYTYKNIFETIAQVVGTLLIVALLVFAARKYLPSVLEQYRSGNEEQIDVRLNDFENRVNDLQDILLSIDARLDRQLRKI